jgi:DNA-binding NarL/FixJ family response regulator
MRVLIADDSHLLVERLVAALDEVGGIEIVGQVGTAAQASEAIQRLKPDVVILDICMPGGSGIDVLEGMRKDQLSPTVVVLTNYGQAQYRKKCLESGATFFFDKSSEFEKVADVLQRLVTCAQAMGGIGNGRVGDVKEGSGNPSRTQSRDGAPAQQEGTTTAERPRLLVSRSSEGEPIYYMCSYCLRGFLLPDIQPQKEAAKELYRSFREHVERKHPESNDGPTTPSAP